MTPPPPAIMPAALVPEHSLPLMTAMSGGQHLILDNYLFFHAHNWLMAIGYPLKGVFDPQKFAAATVEAQKRTAASACFAIAPKMPDQPGATILETDRYYVLSANAPVPRRLRNYVRQAETVLDVRANTEFTAAHRKLWAEFLERAGIGMNERVAELYARTPQAMRKANGSLELLDAYDQAGNIVASLLLDYAPERFASYILGAHSRRHYVPHAVDLLFAKMLESAKKRGKRFIHLGLGVNDGILRFKKKWGAVPSLPFVMAQWEAKSANVVEVNPGLAMALAILRSSGGSVSARQFLQNEPAQRPFAMLWRLEKQGRISWIAGTAHFFCHSFELSFRKLFRHVDNVIFEGPLDAEFMAKVSQAGKNPPQGFTPLIERLTESEIRTLEHIVNGPGTRLSRLLNQNPSRRPVDVRWLLRHGRTWYAFFTLWTSFLERTGWNQSVDMEAWQIARAMDKNVISMESLEEQLESLDSLPATRAVNFFRTCAGWPRRARMNMSAYLAGDLEKMMGSSAEFPTRTEHIVGRRDQRFRERMRPWLEAGRAAVFVGCAHMVNLRQMLAEDGFKVTQAPFGLWPKLHMKWRRLLRPDEKVTWQA